MCFQFLGDHFTVRLKINQNQSRIQQGPRRLEVMSSNKQKQLHEEVRALVKIRKSLQIPQKFFDIVHYQEKIILKHVSVFQWCFVSLYQPTSTVLGAGFCKVYQQLSERDQFLYYETSVKLARELYSNKKLQKKISSQDLPKYPWDKKDLTHSQPKFESGFFDKVTVFYKCLTEENQMQYGGELKVYLSIVSARGHFVQLKHIATDQKSYNRQRSSKNIQMLTPKRKFKSQVIVIDLREFIIHRQKNLEDEKFDIFVLTRFASSGQSKQNQFMSSNNSIEQIYFDIRHYYKYKSRKLIEFYLYSYRQFLQGLLESTPKQGLEIVLKTKKPSQTKNYITSIEFLNDPNDMASEKIMIDLDDCEEGEEGKGEYLVVRHVNGPVDLLVLKSKYDYLKKIDFSKRYQKLWTDWEKDSSNLLTYANEKKLSAQKGVVRQILKKLLANIFSGKSVFSTSLPVTIFENLSLVQKICRCLGYAPLAFRQISSGQNKKVSLYTKIKSIMIIMMGFSILYIQEMAKPFNSVLGQTFQGFIDGCPVYAQQISHHPPITSFFMKGKGYSIHGSLEPTVSFGMNRIVGSNKGFLSVVFEDGDVMSFTFPNTEMGGLVMGERTIKRTGVSYILCEGKKLFGKVEWGPKSHAQKPKRLKESAYMIADSSKEDYMEGKLYKINDSTPVNKQNYTQINERDYDQQVLSFNGNWTSSLSIDNVHEFDFQTEMPFECVQHPCPLPSHSNLREDIKLKKLDQIERSEMQKQKIEVIQRNDRGLRKKYGAGKETQ